MVVVVSYLLCGNSLVCCVCLSVLLSVLYVIVSFRFVGGDVTVIIVTVIVLIVLV